MYLVDMIIYMQTRSRACRLYEIPADHHLLLEIAAAMSEIQARSREEVGKRCRNILGEEVEESSS